MATATKKQLKFGRLRRVCIQCGLALPISAFRAGGAGKMNVFPKNNRNCCRKCRRKLNDEKLETAKAAAADTAFGLIMNGVDGKRVRQIEVPHISELTEMMLQRFSGTESFTVAWKDQIDKAAVAKPGSKTVLDAFAKIANMVVSSTEHRRTAPDVAELNDADLDREFEQSALAILQKSPAALQALLAKAGLEVVRRVDALPGSSESASFAVPQKDPITGEEVIEL